MATEQILDGQYFRRLKDATNNIWERISFWTKAKDVYFEDGTNLETKMSSSGSSSGTPTGSGATGTIAIDVTKISVSSSDDSITTYVMAKCDTLYFFPVDRSKIISLLSDNKKAYITAPRRSGSSHEIAWSNASLFRLANIQELNIGECALPTSKDHLIFVMNSDGTAMNSSIRGWQIDDTLKVSPTNPD